MTRHPSVQGYAIGNPLVDGSRNYDLNGLYAGFHLIPPSLYKQLTDHECQGTLTNFNQSALQSNYSAGLDGAG